MAFALFKMIEEPSDQNANEPPGLETDHLVENDNQDPLPLCISCTRPIPLDRDFCPHCGAANGAYCWLDPWKRIFAEGSVYRRMVSAPLPRWVFGTFVTFLIFNMGSVLYFSHSVLTTEAPNRWRTILILFAYLVCRLLLEKKKMYARRRPAL